MVNIAEEISQDRADRAADVASMRGSMTTLDDCRPRSWGDPVPTVRGKSQATFARRTLRSSAELRTEFLTKYPMLDIPMDGLVVAGGAVAALVANSHWRPKDVDVFFVCEDPDARIKQAFADLVQRQKALYVKHLRERVYGQKVTKRSSRTKDEDEREPPNEATFGGLVTFLLQEGTNHAAQSTCDRIREVCGPNAPLPDTENISVIRTAYSVTLTLDYGATIQFILRKYRSIEEVLLGFDIGACAVGFTGNEGPVLLSRMGRIAHESGANVVDTTRRSPTYESRLIKYWERGFHVALPELDLAKVPTRNFEFGEKEILDLERMLVRCKRIEGQTIHCDAIWVRKNLPQGDLPGEDYEILSMEQPYALAALNYRRVCEGETAFLVHYAAEIDLSGAYAIVTGPPHIDETMIWETSSRLEEQAYDGQRLNLGTLRSHLGDFALTADDTDLRSRLSNAFSDLEARALANWEKVAEADYTKLPWITENPGGQGALLSGSIEPIAEPPAAWYGKYLRELKDV